MQLVASPEVGKIQRFGRYAQVTCVVLFAIVAIGGPVTLLLTTPLQSWTRFSTLYAGIHYIIGFALAFMAIGYLYALFGALAKGEIYTLSNVRRIRRLGALAIAFSVVQIAVPVVFLTLLNAGVLPSGDVSAVPINITFSSLVLLIVGGLIMLASWIMEVGRRTTEDAERLRQDADLVV